MSFQRTPGRTCYYLPEERCPKCEEPLATDGVEKWCTACVWFSNASRKPAVPPAKKRLDPSGSDPAGSGSTPSASKPD